jgi:asparagine synthase (glutamine-hydrolysing)
MCGICGVINFDSKSVSETGLRRMLAAMKHRGPDDEAIYKHENVGLGHVRLSIIDLSIDGKQPFASDDNRYQLVFNGEIYNYLELKKVLIDKGYEFKTKTDTEVLLKSYLHFGEAFLDHLNGMFALAIYDSKRRSLFVARDRYGIKPFYYYNDNDKFIFASDIPPLLGVLERTEYDVNNQILYDYLVFNRTNHTENTFFKNIKKLQHGHALTIDANKVEVKRWYHVGDHIGDPFVSNEDFIESLNLSIEMRLRSDVAVGAALSGGLDSSAIVSLIQKFHKKSDIHTFSAIYGKGENGDESKFINLYRGEVSNMHFVKPTANSLYSDLDNFIDALSEPIPGTSEYAEYKVMENAKKHVTVLLNGQGADEEMGGYIYFSGFLYKELFKSLKWLTILREMRLDVLNHGTYEGPLSFVYFSLPSFLKDFLLSKKSRYISSEFLNNYSGSESIISNLYDADNLKQSLINHFEYKFEHHLLWADKSGMYFSMEARFPFLDHNFVHRILAMPNDKIIRNGTTKMIFREAMSGILPDEITHRQDKVGYETPEDNWFREKKFKELIGDVIHSESFRNMNYFDSDKCMALFQRHLSKDINIASDIWKWLNVFLWRQKYIR